MQRYTFPNCHYHFSAVILKFYLLIKEPGPVMSMSDLQPLPLRSYFASSLVTQPVHILYSVSRDVCFLLFRQVKYIDQTLEAIESMLNQRHH